MVERRWATTSAQVYSLSCTIHLKAPHYEKTSLATCTIPVGPGVYAGDTQRKLDQATCEEIAAGFTAVLNEVLA